jgi:hypothetical protein
VKKVEYTGSAFSRSRIHWAADSKTLINATERNGPTTIFKQSLDGGQVEKLAEFKEDEIFDFGYSFDGQRLAVARGGWQYDLVLLSFNH